MSGRILNAIPGFAKHVGFYLSGMEEVRAQLAEAVAGMSPEQIGRPAVAGAHSIAALVLHIGEAEWYWIQCVVSGNEVTDTIRNSAYWDALEDPASFSQKGYSAEFCLNEIEKIRQQTRETLAKFDDAQLDHVVTFLKRGQTQELSLRWILHHLIDHEAQHKGQILLLKRLLGPEQQPAR
jgi:uncharacterized damage-inducible protein DinB